MSETWPLVGRDEELGLLHARLADVEISGMVLAGAAGTGKSRLARELLRIAADAGHPTERVVASRAAASIPFGAFAHLLPSDHVTPTAGALRAAADRLAERGGAHRLVLLVDDAHLLDAASVALLHRVMLERTVFTLATTRTGDPVPDEVVGLWKDVDAARLEVQPLSRDETVELSEAALGGPLDAATARVLWEASRGNPLHLREVVLAARAAGHLAQERGLWTLAANQLPPPTSLTELVELRLRELAAPAVAAVETLAVAEVLSLDALVALHGSAVVTELERRGLLQAESDGRRRPLRLSHPLYGEVVRARSGHARIAEAARELAGVVQGHGARRRGDLLQLATWQLRAGDADDAPGLVRAAREAYARGSYQLAGELADLARTVDPDDPEASLLRGQLHHEHGRHTEAEVIYAAIRTPDEPRVAARVALQRAVNLFFGLGDEAAAREVLDDASRGWPAAAAELTANRAWLALNAGRPQEAAALVAPLRDAADPDVALMAHVTTAWAEGYGGRPDRALDAAKQAVDLQAATGRTDLNRFRDFPELPRALALLERGDHDDAGALIGAGRARAVEVQARFVLAWWTFLAGRLALRLGDLDEAESAFREGAVIQSRLHQPGLLARDLAGIALVAALRGDLDAARSALVEHDATGPRPERLHAPLGARARAWTAWRSGDLPGATDALRDGVSLARGAGLHAAESELLHDLVRLGAAGPEDAERAVALGDVAGPLAGLRGRHAAAFVGGDPVGLGAVARDFEASGCVLLAADAYAHAATGLTRSGDPAAARRARHAADRLRAQVGPARTPALTEVAERVPLTPREREVVSLATTGLTNREVAAQLGVAKRTVDNLLHRAYGKLGVSNREEAALVLDRAATG